MAFITLENVCLHLHTISRGPEFERGRKREAESNVNLTIVQNCKVEVAMNVREDASISTWVSGGALGCSAIGCPFRFNKRSDLLCMEPSSAAKNFYGCLIGRRPCPRTLQYPPLTFSYFAKLQVHNFWLSAFTLQTP